MAVKKHKLVQDNCDQSDLEILAQYLQLMNNQLTTYLPQPIELIKNIQDIVLCLAEAKSNEELQDLTQSVQVFLFRVVNTVHCSLRHEIVTATMDKLHSYISKPYAEIPAATSVVFTVLDGLDNEIILSEARWLIQQRENGATDSGLKAVLSHLYRWLHEWHHTPSLNDWTSAYITVLEENQRFDILIEVSVEFLPRLFLTLAYPSDITMSAVNVIFHVMASLRESQEALEMVSEYVPYVLSMLASDSHQDSRVILQNVVDILTATINNLVEKHLEKDIDVFKAKFEDMLTCLETHLASSYSRFNQVIPWQTPDGDFLADLKPAARKIGLHNLGNTCYMNSIMQALLVTRQFSTHVMMKMNGAPYWSMMGVLFAKMMYSYSKQLNPDEFLKVVKPPFFSVNIQHDSSEFLGYLLLLLQSYEHRSNDDFDYSRPPVLTAAFRSPKMSNTVSSSAPSSSLATSDIEAASRRSQSPRPGSSTGGSGSGSKRQSSVINISVPPKKRHRHPSDSPYIRRDSVIDGMFGGLLVTRIECAVCHSSSVSRDVFRDLQLAFPEKDDGTKHSVQSLLEFYCSKESLSGDNKYQCSDCGTLRDAEKSVLIESTPKYLILVLKNFKFDPKVQLQTKLMHPMHYNMTVNLPTVRGLAQNTCYSLYAAVIHDGNTPDSGHYYTLAKDNEQWYIYNDETVSQADESAFSKLHNYCTPYILFYKRTDIEDGVPPTLEELPPEVQESVMAHNKDYIETTRALHLSGP